jgi:CRP-like cAMP-binding protein
MSPTPEEKTTHLFSRSQRLSKRLGPVDEKSGREMTGCRSGSQREKIPIKSSDLLDRLIEGITNLQYRAKETVFSQGDPSDCIFFIQKGKVKLTVVSTRGREAIVGVLGASEFVGE